MEPGDELREVDAPVRDRAARQTAGEGLQAYKEGNFEKALRLFEEAPALENGQLVVPKKPGLGLAFDQTALKRFQVS